MSFPDTPTSYTSTPAAPLGHPSTWPTPAPPAHVRPPRRGLVIVAALGVLALMAATGFGVWLITRSDGAEPVAGPSGSGTLEVTGVVTLQRGQFVWQSTDDPTCDGWQGFADIRSGTQVTVTDAAGKTLAVGAVSTGTAQGISTEADGSHRASSCMLPFKVSGVARAAGPYGVEVGHRGMLRYNEGDLSGLMLGFS